MGSVPQEMAGVGTEALHTSGTLRGPALPFAWIRGMVFCFVSLGDKRLCLLSRLASPRPAFSVSGFSRTGSLNPEV